MSVRLNNLNHPVILFIPEAGIYPFMRGLSVLGDAVQKNGGKVYITHDTGQMLRSPIMGMYRTSVDISAKQHEKIRRATEKRFKDVIKNYDFSTIELSDLVDDQMMKQIDSLANEKTANLKEIHYRGFPVGEMSEFDFILETKFPYYAKLSRPHKKLYLQFIKNTALAIAVTDKICDIYKPSLLLAFNEYAQCQAVKYSASTHNTRYMMLTYPVHLNIDASRFSICGTTYSHWRYQHCQKWNNEKGTPISAKDVSASWNDSVFRLYSSGSHIFSSRKERDPRFIFNKLRLDPKRRTIVAYTSSQDERRCGEISMKIWNDKNPVGDVFKNQIEWLLFLRKYATRNKNIQVVVRIHPREGSGRRGIESEHLHKLKDKFAKNSDNFIIVWPDDPISSYDLMELADLCLVAWSVVGQEAARLGIPVLTHTRNMFYPDDDFVQVATTPLGYHKKLDAMLDMKYKWKYLVGAVRYYHWRTFIPSMDLGKVTPTDSDDDTVWPRLSKSFAKPVNDILSGKKDLIEYNIKNWRRSLPKNAKSLEKKAMKEGIRYFIDKTFYPPRNLGMLPRIWRYGVRKILRNSLWVPPSTIKDYQLKYTEDTSKIEEYIKMTRNNLKLRFLVADGSQAILINKGRLLKRMSPMIIRLAKLHENA